MKKFLAFLTVASAAPAAHASTTVSTYKLTRIERTSTQVMDRAEDLGLWFTQETSLTHTLADWSVPAAADGAAGRHFDDYPEIVVHYSPYDDGFYFYNMPYDETVPVPPGVPTDGEMDRGIDLGLAEAQAVVFKLSLESSGLLGSNSYTDYPIKIGEDRSAMTAGVGTDRLYWVDAWEFVYQREVDGDLFLGSYVSYTIDRTGALVGVSVVERHTVDDEGTVQADWSPAYALANVEDYIQDLADGHVPFTDSPSYYEVAFWTRPLVGYAIPGNVASAWVEPAVYTNVSVVSSHATHTGGDEIYSLARPARISLVDPGDSMEDVFPPGGYKEHPTQAFDDGRQCNEDEDCDSGYCYNPAGFFGICGDCNHEDEGCSAGNRCKYQDPLDPSVHPICVSKNQATGEGLLCESNSECGKYFQSFFQAPYTCAPIVEDSLIPLSTCSYCEDDGDCGGRDPHYCDIHVDFTDWKIYRQCEEEDSQVNGTICDLENDGHLTCQSGECAVMDLGALSVGVCSECDEDADCGMGEYCDMPTIDYFVTNEYYLKPATCESL